MSVLLSRSVRIDAIRFLAAIAVVGVHCFGFLEEVALTRGHTMNVFWIHASLRWCVPVFIMVTGFLLLDPRRGEKESVQTFWRRRFQWLLPVLVFWAAFYTAFRMAFGHEHTWSEQWINIAIGRPFLHLWYLYLLPGLYLIAPVFRSFIKQTSISTVWIFIAGITALIFGDMCLASLMPTRGATPWPLWFIGSLPAFLLGYQVALLPKRFSSAVGLLTAVVGCGLTVILVNHGHSLFMNYDGPSVLLMSCGVYLFFLRCPSTKMLRSFGTTDFSRRLYATSLGVYLVHPAILSSLKRLPVSWQSYPTLVVGIFLWIAVLLLSIGIVMSIKKIPGLRNIV